MAEPGHWDAVYQRSAVTEVSWFQADPVYSTQLVAASGIDLNAPIIDVGGGASVLVDRLLDAGRRNITVLDVAADALATARSRLGSRGDAVHWITADLLAWDPPHRYRLWHDRAVFHFLTDPRDRDRYRAVLGRALAPDGYALIATFAADGPTSCSGLPTARYDPDELAAQFPELRVVRSVREEHHTPSGRIQPFTWQLMTWREGRTTPGDCSG